MAYNELNAKSGRLFLHREGASKVCAPGVAEKAERLQFEVVDEIVQLLHEEFSRPEVGIEHTL